MNKRLFIIILLFVGTMLLGACASGVKFKGISALPGKEVKLNGTLLKPEGNGPFPAVVLLHRCSGIKDWDYSWASRLKSWGYVAFIVDSFGPRGIAEACGYSADISFLDRALDAHSAKSYLAGLSFVDRNKIAVMGWSHGGVTTLSAINPNVCDFLPPPKKHPFRAAIAFYPRCSQQMDNLNAPLLILIGEKDDWTPADVCSMMLPKGNTKHEVILKIYQGAYHCFDCIGLNNYYHGHFLSYHDKATSDSIVKVKQFLAKHLK